MKNELLGKKVINITFIILLLEVLIRITALVPKVNIFYADLFAGIALDFNIIILYIIPFLNMFMLILYLISTYILKWSKNWNFQILMYIMFYLLFLINSYMFLLREA